MESFTEKAILGEITTRLIKPAKYKMKLYQITLLMYIDHILTLAVKKYVLIKVKIEEKKSTLISITQQQQSQIIKLDILSKENLQRSLLVIKHFKYKINHGFVKLQSMHEHCLTHEQTPKLFCEPYIHTGFRPVNQSYLYYAKSLFRKHNETVNAWSHYIGALYTISLAFKFDFSDPYSWPILTCIVTATLMFISSATAHLMHQKSHHCHMTCFLCDFAGISFNGFGAALMQTYMCSPIWYYRLIEPYILPLIGLQSILCLLLNSIAQTKYKRPYPPIKRFLQFAPCAVLWLFTMFPLIASAFGDSSAHELIKVSYSYHLAHLILFLLGAACFALDFPQNLFPGRLDFFGQGHHLFHMCIFFVVAIQLNGCYQDYLLNREVIAATRIPPTLFYCFFSLFCIVLYYIYIVRCFNKMVCHNFDSNGNYIEKKKKEDHEKTEKEEDDDDNDDGDDEDEDEDDEKKIENDSNLNDSNKSENENREIYFESSIVEVEVEGVKEE